MKEMLKGFLRHDTHPAIQFIKYGIAGGIATAVDILVFYILAWKVFPALTANDQIVQTLHLPIIEVAESVRWMRYLLDRSITFLFSNTTAYIVNILWVFKPGRHARWIEVSLFFAVSLISYGIGTGIGTALIKWYAFTTTSALVANIVASLAINYLCRKYIIFKG